MGAIEEPRFSLIVMMTLLAVLSTSLAMFGVLVVRWTNRRHRHEVLEWVRTTGFHKGRLDDVPAALIPLAGPVIAPLDHLYKGTVTLMRLFPPPGVSESPIAPLHLLARRIESDWKPTGLRPVREAGAPMLVDHFHLTGLAAQGENERFQIVGTETAAAQALAMSSIRALLPADLGLLLHGNYLVIDFSTRPFDTIEFTRMIALSDQLVANLPAPRRT